MVTHISARPRTTQLTPTPYVTRAPKQEEACCRADKQAGIKDKAREAEPVSREYGPSHQHNPGGPANNAGYLPHASPGSEARSGASPPVLRHGC